MTRRTRALVYHYTMDHFYVVIIYEIMYGLPLITTFVATIGVIRQKNSRVT